MFKKLVVGALATGIALTGGLGQPSASTESTESSVTKWHQYVNLITILVMVSMKDTFIILMKSILILFKSTLVMG